MTHRVVASQISRTCGYLELKLSLLTDMYNIHACIILLHAKAHNNERAILFFLKCISSTGSFGEHV